MDPEAVSVISQAVAAGAAAGCKDTASHVVTDTYVAFRRLLTGRYQRVDVGPVEDKPDSPAKRDSLAEDLADAGAGGDAVLLEAARQLLAAINAHAADTGPVIGVDLHRLEAAAVRIRDVAAQGTGVHGDGWKVAGDVEISGVRAGGPAEPLDPSGR